MIHSENERMAGQWLRMEEDLLRERGLFGPGPGVFLKRGWVQNTAEGRNRTRSRIRRKELRRSKKVNYPQRNIIMFIQKIVLAVIYISRKVNYTG